jgi:hypothetical protein
MNAVELPGWKSRPSLRAWPVISPPGARASHGLKPLNIRRMRQFERTVQQCTWEYKRHAVSLIGPVRTLPILRRWGRALFAVDAEQHCVPPGDPDYSFAGKAGGRAFYHLPSALLASVRGLASCGRSEPRRPA